MKKLRLLILCGILFILVFFLMGPNQKKFQTFKEKGIGRCYEILIAFKRVCGCGESLQKKSSKEAQKKVVWINVFIHGTVGSTLAFFNFSSITNDKIEHTNYKKLVNSMRRDRFMFQDQPIFDKGLVEIDPNIEFCFDRKKVCYGAYPILNLFNFFLDFCSAYDIEEMKGKLDDGVETKNIFYLFGWSGFLSQKRRRLEAVRAYNQIGEKVKFYEALGFLPKVRLLAHSHGGNVALNLGGIGLSFEPQEKIQEFYNNFEIGFYIKSAFENLLDNLPEKDIAFTRKGQKRFDYVPDVKFKVDELVMFGTPLQEETLLFSSTDFFDVTYNIYSEADVIQSLDFVTTVKKQSLQRVENFETDKKKLCQVQIIINNTSDKTERVLDPKILHPTKKTSWWHVLLGLKDTSRKLPDPTHRELWFIVGEDGTKFNFLRPLPIVCFFPIIQKLHKIRNKMDNYFVVTDTDDSVVFELKDRVVQKKENKDDVARVSMVMAKSNFLQIKDQLTPWVGLRSNLGGRAGIMRKFIRLERKYNL